MSASNDTRMALMEKELQLLRQDRDAEKKEFKALKAEFNETKAKITTAEKVGRLGIWMLLGASAFLTQFQGVLAWIRKG